MNIKRFGTAEMTLVAKQAKNYICSSIQLAYERALNAVNIKMEIESKHPLVLLAEDVKEIVIKDESLFAPILSRWNHQALAISTSLVHDMYQKEFVRLQTLPMICYFERFSSFSFKYTNVDGGLSFFTSPCMF